MIKHRFFDLHVVFHTVGMIVPYSAQSIVLSHSSCELRFAGAISLYLYNTIDKIMGVAIPLYILELDNRLQFLRFGYTASYECFRAL